jgi:cytochrome c peroxidase
MFPILRVALAVVALVAVADSAPRAAENGAGFYSTRFERTPSPAELTALGRALFFEPRLSASGRQSCASCHDPAHAYGPPDDRAVERGGVDSTLYGVRAVPSLRYLQSVPPFTEHYMETDGNDSEDQGPAGGHGWDGRVSSKHEQARIPLLSPFEMANANEGAVVARIAGSRHADPFRAAFGQHLFDDPDLAFKAAVLALEVFQQSPEDFYPYSSKYDAYLRHRATLSLAEERGLALFNDATKGNCASCHPSRIKEGGFPAFTDFGFVALGVPRNPAIPANRRPDYRDLGLCGPYRTDLSTRSEYCGRFRAPTMRNVALRRTFFHNGVVHSLTAAVRFYVERDLHPERWYPTRAGKVVRDDDLPPRYRANLEAGAPFTPLPGGKPALDDREIADIVAFLGTLTDGYEAPARPRLAR